MNETIKFMLTRRTIRKYQQKQISKADLDEILKAGIHAPNAGDAQSAIIVASQDKALNDKLGKIKE